MAKIAGRSRYLGGVALSLALGACAYHQAATAPVGDGHVVQKGEVTCVYPSPENQLTPLSACELKTDYVVTAGDQKMSWSKASFQRAFRERFWQFIRGTDYPWKTLGDGTVQFWLEAPLFTPEKAYFVAVVMGRGGNFSLELPLDPASWRMGEAGLAWLGQDRYPSLAALRTDRLVVTPLATVSPARLRAYVEATGALEERTAGGDPAVVNVKGDGTALELDTAPFSAGTVATRLLRPKDARFVLADVRSLPAGDLAGYKSPAFTFDLR